MKNKKVKIQQLVMGAKSSTRLIPDGELKCIWMTAGLVAYKLCDQGYNCEFCSFNEAFLADKNFSTIGQAITKKEEKP